MISNSSYVVFDLFRKLFTSHGLTCLDVFQILQPFTTVYWLTAGIVCLFTKVPNQSLLKSPVQTHLCLFNTLRPQLRFIL